MCTECFTAEIRELVPRHEEDEYFTLRTGKDLGQCLLIVGPQEIAAHFVFTRRPEWIRATLEVDDAAACARFLYRYAESKGRNPDDFEELVRELEAEALVLFPRLPELARQSRVG